MDSNKVVAEHKVGNFHVVGIVEGGYIPLEKKTEEGKQKVGFLRRVKRRIELCYKGKNVATFILTHRKGSWSVSDSRQQDKENILHQTEKGYTLEGLCTELSRMVGEVGHEIVAAVSGQTATKEAVEVAKASGKKVQINVYMNFRKDGKNGEEIFLEEMAAAGIKDIPEYHRNNVEAKYDSKGNMVSPWFAWQGTVTLPEINADQVANLVKSPNVRKVADTLVIHSNELTRNVLAA